MQAKAMRTRLTVKMGISEFCRNFNQSAVY